MTRARQPTRPLRGVAGLQELLLAMGLEAEARLLPGLAEDVEGAAHVMRALR